LPALNLPGYRAVGLGFKGSGEMAKNLRYEDVNFWSVESLGGDVKVMAKRL